MRHECWTGQESLSCSPWKSVCHYWTAADTTHNCIPGWESILAIIAGWMVSVCGFCLCGIRSWKLNLQQSCWVERAGPIAWPGRSCDFIPIDIFWTNITEHIYIPPFRVLVMEVHTELEHVLRPAIIWYCAQHKVVILFQCFGITNQSHLQGSRWPSRTCLDSRQPAHTGCLLEELTVTELI